MRALFAAGVAALVLFAQSDEPRPAAEILRDIRRVDFPSTSMRNSAEARNEFERAIGEAAKRRAALILELYEGHPDHVRVPSEMKIRWDLLITRLAGHEAVLSETEAVLERSTAGPLAGVALYHRAFAALFVERIPWKEKLARIDTLERNLPRSESVSRLLFRLADEHTPDEDQRVPILERISRDFPESQRYVPEARAMLELSRHRGEKLQLAFDDAVTGNRLDLEDLRGRVVAVQFWSPAAIDDQGIERLRALLQSHPDDFAVVGVLQRSTTQGSPPLEDVLRRLRVTWPQYNEYARTSAYRETWSWKLGIRRSPTILVVGRDGRLASTNAHRHLEEVVSGCLRPEERGTR